MGVKKKKRPLQMPNTLVVPSCVSFFPLELRWGLYSDMSRERKLRMQERWKN